MTSPISILVVEDDASILLGLEMNLRAEGYEVLTCTRGDEALTIAKTAHPTLIVLDIMLPGKNGLEVLKDLRAGGDHPPVILLSARGAELDKVLGLELGAEDYVTKPFGVAELLARIKTVLRRGRGPVHQRVAAAGLEIRISEREVLRNGALIELTTTEFEILLLLVRAAGGVLSREHIQSAVWGPNHHGTPRTIDNFVLQLRSKIEVDPATPQHLITVRGVGYRFVA